MCGTYCVRYIVHQICLCEVLGFLPVMLEMQAFPFKELEILVAVNDLPIPIVVLESSMLYQGLELEFLLVVASFPRFLGQPLQNPLLLVHS